MPRMDDPDGVTLRYDVAGSGEPVLLIHGAFIVDTYKPLVDQEDLLDRYQLFTYARRGYVGSSPTTGITSVGQHADDCRALLSELGVDEAHVVGHSYGGCVALQLALEAPHVVHSLGLIEPALMVGTTALPYRESLVQARDRFRKEGASTALDEGLEARCPGYRAKLDRALPGAFEQAVDDASATFENELPGLLEWTFGPEEARRITQPALSILGGESNALWPRFGETHSFLLDWLPDVEGFVLPGTTHLPQIEDPRGLAKALSSFWAQHPIEGA